jgi:molybdopterin-biosynthesis enzyme MoeA-like protein
LTCEGIGKAFDSPLVMNPDMLKFWSTIYAVKRSVDEALISKMARIPKISHVSNIDIPAPNGGKRSFPMVSASNVFIFPGIPRYVQVIIVNNLLLFISLFLLSYNPVLRGN